MAEKKETKRKERVVDGYRVDRFVDEDYVGQWFDAEGRELDPKTGKPKKGGKKIAVKKSK